jgi:hypothetical protein
MNPEIVEYKRGGSMNRPVSYTPNHTDNYVILK